MYNNVCLDINNCWKETRPEW